MIPRALCLAVAFTLSWSCLSLGQGAAPASPGSKPLTAEQKEKLKERDRLRAEASRLYTAGKKAEAVVVWKKLVEVEKEVYGPEHDEVMSSLDALAVFHEQAGQFGPARAARAEVVAALQKRLGKGHWRTADARRDLAHTEALARMSPDQRARLDRAERRGRQAEQLRRQGKYEEALTPAREGAQLLAEVLGKQHSYYAAALNRLAILHRSQRRRDKAEPLHREVLEITKEVQGTRHPSYAAALYNLARFYASGREYARAEPMYRQTLEVVKEVYGEQHPTYASVLTSLGTLYDNRGESARAEPLFRQAIAIRKEAGAVKDPDYIAAINNLAGLYRARGEYARALPLYREARAAAREVRGEKHPLYASVLTNLANHYISLGDLAQAEPLLKQAAAIREEVLGKKHPDYADSLNSLGFVRDSLGDYARAESLLGQALALRKEVLGEEHPDYATSLNNLALLAYHRGDYARAESLFGQARAVRKEAQGEAHPDYTRSLQNLALLCEARGDYARAEALLQQALGIEKAAGRDRHPSYASYLNNLGFLCYSLGDYKRAEPLLERARAIRKEALGERHPDYATSLNNLATLYFDRKEYARAEPLFRQALAINKEAYGEKHPRHAAYLISLADLTAARGDHAGAEPLYERALDLQKEILGEEHPDYAHTLHRLARLHRDRGDSARAEALFGKAIRVRKEALGEKHPDYAKSLRHLALVLASRGEHARAEPLAREGLAVTTDLAQRTLQGLALRQRLRLLDSLRGALGAWLSVAPEAGVGPGDLYRAVLDWKGAASQRGDLRLVRGNPELEEVVGRLTQVRRDLAVLAFRAPAPREREAWLDRLDQLREQKEELEGRLARDSLPFRAARRRPGSAELARSLPEGVALVDFLDYTHVSLPAKGPGELHHERRLLAFVLCRGRKLRAVSLGATAPVAGMVQRWRKALLSGDGPDLARAGARLRGAVWKPLAPHLAGAKTVLLSPDGPLCSLPFAALPGSRPQAYLVEELAIGYLPSARHLQEVIAPHDKRTGRGLLAVGEVAYQADKGPFPPLPGTGPEAVRCRERFRTAFPDERALLLRGDEAREGKVTGELGSRPRYVHLATHGFFESPARLAALRAGLEREEDLPAALQAREEQTFALASLLRCGIALAGAGRTPTDAGGEDGILTAEEVIDVDLGGCELVTLSACQTALGQIERGEGVMGLQRAFHAAGARSVVASLWHVDDAATSLLMEEFYANLWVKKLPRLEALRRAQLSLLRDPEGVARRSKELRAGWAKRGLKGTKALPPLTGPDAKKSHPALWAAFVLSGDWR